MHEEAEKMRQLQAALLALGFEWNKQYALRRTGTMWQLRWLQPITYAQLTQAEKLLQAILNGTPS